MLLREKVPMTTISPGTVRPPRTRRLLHTLWLGLALTVAIGIVPLIDLATTDSLYTHVQDAYPDWPSNLVRGDRNAITIALEINAVLGVLTWLCTIWAVAAGKRWARRAITIAFLAGTSLALINQSFTGGQYDTVLPSAYGALGLVPSVAGLAALVMVWQRRAVMN
jgi:hypothetical protein